VVVDPSGAIFVADLGNGLVRKLTPNPPQVTGVVNAASMLGGPVAPGELATLFGSFFDPSSTQVLFDGQAVPLLYLDAGQINLETPSAFASPSSSVLEVKTPAGAASITLSVAAANPGFFPVVLNADGSLNAAAQPAPAGSVVTLYATGAGNSQPLSAAIANLPAAIVSSQKRRRRPHASSHSPRILPFGHPAGGLQRRPRLQPARLHHHRTIVLDLSSHPNV